MCRSGKPPCWVPLYLFLFPIDSTICIICSVFFSIPFSLNRRIRSAVSEVLSGLFHDTIVSIGYYRSKITTKAFDALGYVMGIGGART